jgi:redox-sensitive bicupin YhaK (pirin superfamily)
LETEETHMYQIWITPKEKNLKPSWAQAKFDHLANNTMQLLVSGDGTAPLNINQDAKLYLAKISEGQSVRHRLMGNAYLVVLDGKLSDHQEILYQGDGLELKGEDEIKLVGHTNVELLLIELGV